MSGSEIRNHVERDYPDYLRDESRRAGVADGIAFPQTEEDVQALLREAAARGLVVTTQGARTGITAGAVPPGGLILNLSRMNRFLGLRRDAATGDFLLRAQPGVRLSEVSAALAQLRFDFAPRDEADARASAEALAALRAAGPRFFAPDPTETSASLGGMAACNASGARSFLYGATRRHIAALRIVLADGDVLALRRGELRARGRTFSLRTAAGRSVCGELPHYAMPRVKNAAGFHAEDDMDLLDLFIGSEGTLGVISELELRLMPSPGARCGVMAFFEAEAPAVAFVKAVRAAATRPAAVEFFDQGALRLLRGQKQRNPAFHEIPDIPEAAHTAIYVELHGAEGAVDAATLDVAEMLDACGGDPDATWTASDEPAIERMKAFRHAVPEAVNLLIDERRKREPKLTKLGTDLAVPDAALDEVLALYRQGLERTGLEAVTFGHIGNNHVHVNILPVTLADYERGRALYLEWARAVLAMGGTVSAEHGIGKLKTELLRAMYGDEGLGQMRAVKRIFDPQCRLNPGNLFGA